VRFPIIVFPKERKESQYRGRNGKSVVKEKQINDAHNREKQEYKTGQIVEDNEKSLIKDGVVSSGIV